MTTNIAFRPFVTAEDFFADPVFSCGLDATLDADLVVELIDLASDILAFATGGRVRGRTTMTFRPVHTEASHQLNEMVGAFAPSINGRSPLPLPGPDPEVTEVVVDGVVLAPTEYVVVDGQFLLRVGAAWPWGNDLELADTEDGTWSVTVRFGEPTGGLARRAAMSLVQEMAAPYTGRVSRLPNGVTAANVQGASVTVESAAEALRDGVEDTTIHLQRFLGLYAADGRNGGGVFSPELAYGWRLHTVGHPVAS